MELDLPCNPLQQPCNTTATPMRVSTSILLLLAHQRTLAAPGRQLQKGTGKGGGDPQVCDLTFDDVEADCTAATLQDVWREVKEMHEQDPEQHKATGLMLDMLVAAGVRTVVLSRAVVGASKDHFSIPTSPGQINLITATGNTNTIAYHKARTGTQITLVPTKVSACVCKPTVHKYFLEHAVVNGTEKEIANMEYAVNCLGQPRSDMANPAANHQDKGANANHWNPACDGESYHGGLHCCHHQVSACDPRSDPSALGC